MTTTPHAELLTDEELDALDKFSLHWGAPRQRDSVRAYGRAIERALLARLGEQQTAGIGMAAQWVRQRQVDFIEQQGCTDPETGALSFGRGPHAEAKQEYVCELEEIIEGIEGLTKCDVPPAGWTCTRAKGHAGPCAAHPPAAQAPALTDERIPSGYNRPPNGEPCNFDDWNAGYAAGVADASKAAQPVAQGEREAFEAWLDGPADGARGDVATRRMTLTAEQQEYARIGWLASRSSAQGAAQVPQWLPISEAPKDGTRLLCAWGDQVHEGWCTGVGTARDGGDVWRSHSLVPVTGRPTHFMHLPAAPHGEGER